MRKYLVTGGAGFIGTSIAKELLKEKIFVRILDNEFRGSAHNLPKGKNLELIKGDIRNPLTVKKACQQIDCIIHLAFINGTRYFYEQPDLVLDVGVKGILNVLDAARSQKVSELFLASSSEVYQTTPQIPTPENVPMSIPDPYNPRYSYAGGKIISELMTIHYGKKYFKRAIIFRPHNVYGPDMGEEHVIPELLLKIKKQGSKSVLTLPIQGSGNETRAFIFIDDFIDGLLILLRKGKHLETYNIGTTEEVSIKKLIQTMERVVGKKIVIAPQKLRLGSTYRRCPDIKKIKRLGFAPKVSLEEGLRKTYMWYNSHQ